MGERPRTWQQAERRAPGYAAAIALFEEYVRRPERFWPSGAQFSEHRQLRKLKTMIHAAADAMGDDAEAATRRAASLALERAAHRPPPIYVMGLGGSGSQWIAEMLTELLDAIYPSEVYIPSSLMEQMETMPREERGLLVDCLHLIHALGHPMNAGLPIDGFVGARAINPAGGVAHPRIKAWDPKCFVVHMLRDPRDQVISVTFRKLGYRQEIAPNASDDEYLTRRAKAAVRNSEAWRNSAVGSDFSCHYEELRRSPVLVLERLLSSLGKTVEPMRVAEVARNYDASLMQKGLVRPRGNFFLDDGRGSRREPSERQRALLHVELAEVRNRAQYPADDCLGRALDLAETRGDRSLHFPSSEALGTLFIRCATKRPGATWRRLSAAAGNVTVPADTSLKLRIHEAAHREAIESLRTLPPDGLESLCLAGNAALDDDLLGTLTASLHQLRELDLARTGVCDNGIARLASLQQLQGLNLIGTDASAHSVAALRTAMPSLEIII
jgi:hypothetical protein